jgi:hypothetical protein
MKIRLLTLTVILAACAGTVRAQPVSGSGASVEWEALNSCLVVRAVIDGAAVHPLKDGLYPDQGIRRYQTVSARVLETLKGPPAARLQFVHDGDFGAVRLADLQRNRREVLLCLESWMQSSRFSRASGGYAYTRFPHVVRSAVILDPAEVRWAFTSVPVLSSKLTRLTTPKQVIDTIRRYLKTRRDREPVQGAVIQLPPGLRGGFYRVDFTFPVDAAGGEALQRSAVPPPVVDFATFKVRFARQRPATGKASYSRSGSAYVGVSALERMAADCDLIVRGVIEDWCFVSRTEDPTGDSCGVKVRVSETIKGRSSRRIACFVSDAGDLAALQRDGTDLILFLRSSRKHPVPHPEGALEYRTRAGLWDDSVIVLRRGAVEVLFADLAWSRDPEAIAARLRAAVKPAVKRDDARVPQTGCPPAELPVFHFHPPAAIAAGTSIVGNPYSVVYLPVNAELEANARAWASASHPDLRWVAARAMVYFRSDRNAALLQRMLNDRATWERREMLAMTGLSYPYQPEFLVRWEAWHVLSGWGYEVPRPAFCKGAIWARLHHQASEGAS